MNEEIIPHAWRTNFNTLIFVDEMIIHNHYDVEVGFDTSTTNYMLHDIAFEKIEMFFDVLLQNGIIISQKDFEARPQLKNNFIELPNMLNDQTFGSAIYSKLLSLVGKDMSIVYIKISSSLGKDIIYTINDNSPEYHTLLPSKEEWWNDDKVKFQPWWTRPDPATYDILLKDDEIYLGEFDWNDHFEEELEEAKTLDSKRSKFEIIKGGKGDS